MGKAAPALSAARMIVAIVRTVITCLAIIIPPSKRNAETVFFGA
jgi:hypothetical protein